jgi:lipoic acid synthetase
MAEALISSIPTRSRLERELRRGVSLRARPDAAGEAGRRPEWLKVRVRQGDNFRELRRIMRERGLHTVCEEAGCPNIFECWEAREATFLLCGDLCTRRCAFCDVMTRRPEPLDPEEPAKLAEAVRLMGLRFAVVTGVARDDLDDAGSAHWAATVRAIRAGAPECGVEVLIPDFKGRRERPRDSLARVVDAAPDVLAHNLETVRRIHPRIRPGFGYDASLELLRAAKELRPGQVTKSNIIVGMGETEEEVREAMRDLRAASCDLLTIGQYLQPSAQWHLPVDRWVHPEEFARYREHGEGELGFALVEAGPLVRSSYHAGRQFRRAAARRQEPLRAGRRRPPGIMPARARAPSAGHQEAKVTYIIAEPCIGVKDRACVDECPVDCIYEGEDQLYIHPEECVDCDACLPACPVDAIFPADSVPAEWQEYIPKNTQWFEEHPDASGGAMESPFAPAEERGE